jgi:hypothetical protein
LGNSTKKSQEFVKLWSAEGRFWGWNMLKPWF